MPTTKTTPSVRPRRLVGGAWDALLPWFRLFRLTNLLTVPGDAWAGAVYSALLTGATLSGTCLLCLTLCPLLMYIFGCAQNDWHDLQQDQRRHPERPLAKGDIHPMHGALAAIVAAAAALAVSLCLGRTAFLCALCQFLLINAYNLRIHGNPVSAAVALGLIQGFNFLLGAVSVHLTGAALLPAVAVSIYVGLIFWLHFNASRTRLSQSSLFATMIPLFFGWLLGLLFLPLNGYLGLAMSALLMLMLCAILFFTVNGYANRFVSTGEMQGMLAACMRCLMPWQATWLLVAYGQTIHPLVLPLGLGLIALWLIGIFTRMIFTFN